MVSIRGSDLVIMEFPNHLDGDILTGDILTLYYFSASPGTGFFPRLAWYHICLICARSSKVCLFFKGVRLNFLCSLVLRFLNSYPQIHYKVFSIFNLYNF